MSCDSDDSRKFLAQLWSWTPSNYKRGPHPMIPLPTPSSTMRRDLQYLSQEPYLVAEKNDGVRAVLILGIRLDADNSTISERILRNGDVKDVSCRFSFTAGDQIEQGSALDGEWIEDDAGAVEYVVFDCIAAFGFSVKDADLTQRLTWANYVVQHLTCSSGSTIRVKEFFNPSTDPAGAARCIQRAAGGSPRTDGLIFAPVRRPVGLGRQHRYFKFKPLNMITVDLAWDPAQRRLRCDGFRGDAVEAVVPGVQWDVADFAGLGPSIVECEVSVSDTSAYILCFKCQRRDKTRANSAFVVERTCQNARENIVPDELLRALALTSVPIPSKK